MTFKLKPAVEFSIPDLAQFFNQAFAGYIGGNVEFTPITYMQFLTRDNTDLTLSRVVLREDQPAGFCLIARQGWTSRIAAMGILPEAKGQGVGKWLLEQIIQEATQRGDQGMVLEAYEENTPAVNLYKRMGFEIVRRLIGYTAPSLNTKTHPDLQELDVLQVAKIVMYYGAADLPWQMSGTAVARSGPPARAYQLDHAYAIVANSTPETMILRSLLVLPEYRRQGEATRLLQALAGQYHDKQWVIPPICPEEFGLFLEPIGFAKQEHIALQMGLNLR